MEGAHARQAGVEGEQEVEALGGPDLADQDAARAHPERLLHQVAQHDLAGLLQPGLPGLHRDPVGVGEAQFEDLLRTHHPLTPGHGGGEAVEHGGLAGLGAARDEDVEPGPHRRLEEAGSLGRQAAQRDEVGQPVGAQQELADVDCGEAAGDAFEDDVETVALGEHRVDERCRDVEPAPARLEHPLDELVDLRGVEAQVGQLVAAAAGDEDPAGVVDPDLLDLRVVEEGLQRTEARHPSDQLTHHGAVVGDGRDRARQAEVVVVADHVLGDAAHERGLALRVDALAPDPLPHLQVEPLDEVVDVRSRDAINGHVAPYFPRTCTDHATQPQPRRNRPAVKVVENS